MGIINIGKKAGKNVASKVQDIAKIIGETDHGILAPMDSFDKMREEIKKEKNK